MSQLWAALDAGNFELRHFSDEAVLFDRRDGSTHYLSVIGTAILQVLAASACDTAELMARLESRFNIALGTVEQNQIGLMLQQLAALRLVTCRGD